MRNPVKIKFPIIRTEFTIPKQCLIICTIEFKCPFDNNRYIVKGSAKCHPKDDYSVELGDRIAESRAKTAMFQKIKQILYEFSHDVNWNIRRFDDCATKEKNHVKDLIKDYYPD